MIQQFLPVTTLAPMSFMVAKKNDEKISMRLLRVLFDSGGSATMIHDQCLPKGCNSPVLTSNVILNTVAEIF